MVLPNLLYNFAVLLFVLNLSTLVVLFVGWLTHANYYYKLYETVDDVAIFVHSLFTAIFGFIGIIGYLVDDSKPRLFDAIISLNGLYVAAILLVIVLGYLQGYIMKVHNYFGNKRGR